MVIYFIKDYEFWMHLFDLFVFVLSLAGLITTICDFHNLKDMDPENISNLYRHCILAIIISFLFFYSKWYINMHRILKNESQPECAQLLLSTGLFALSFILCLYLFNSKLFIASYLVGVLPLTILTNYVLVSLCLSKCSDKRIDNHSEKTTSSTISNS